MTQNDPAATRDPARPGPRLHHKVRHHLSRAHEAWKRYYHYKRLEEHGQPLPWHGRKGWHRMVLTASIVLAVIAFGLWRHWTEAEPGTVNWPW